MTWRVAYSLDQLLRQINALAPKRSRASDGAIGDEEHKKQGSASDHNPWFVLGGQALVTARDFTHDPANGLDCNKLAAALIAAKDPRVKYLIWQGRLMDSRAVAGNGYRPWTWQTSSGHYQHLHLSVMANASADDSRPWSLPGLNPQEDTMSAADAHNGIASFFRELASDDPNPAIEQSRRDVAKVIGEMMIWVPEVNPDGTPKMEDDPDNPGQQRQVGWWDKLSNVVGTGARYAAHASKQTAPAKNNDE